MEVNDKRPRRRVAVAALLAFFVALDAVVTALLPDVEMTALVVSHAVGLVAGVATAWLIAASARRRADGGEGRKASEVPVLAEAAVFVGAAVLLGLLPGGMLQATLWAVTGWLVGVLVPMASSQWPSPITAPRTPA